MHHLSHLTSSPTNHHPTLTSTIDKNVTVRFYPWPHHPRGYYLPSRTTPSCLSSPRSSLPLFLYSLPTIRGVELILWLYRFHKLSVCRFAPHSTISPLVTPTQSFAIFSLANTALYFHTRLLSTHNCTYTYNHPSLPPDRSIFSKDVNGHRLQNVCRPEKTEKHQIMIGQDDIWEWIRTHRVLFFFHFKFLDSYLYSKNTK